MTSYSHLIYIGVLVAVFANQLCLPVPAVVFLVSAGAPPAHGHMSASLIALLSVLPCLAADSLWFWLGRRWGSQAMRLLCRLTPDPRGCAETAHRKFSRYGLPVLFVAKFLPGLDGLLPPLAGAEGVPFPSFFSLDAAGSLALVGFLCRAWLCFLESTGSCCWVGKALWHSIRGRDRGFVRALCRLGRTHPDPHDSPPGGAANQPAHAPLQAEIRQQSRSARSARFRR